LRVDIAHVNLFIWADTKYYNCLIFYQADSFSLRADIEHRSIYDLIWKTILGSVIGVVFGIGAQTHISVVRGVVRKLKTYHLTNHVHVYMEKSVWKWHEK
jgi:hypothetical protein